MIMRIALALLAGTFPAMAQTFPVWEPKFNQGYYWLPVQNSFPTPGGASVRGVVLMCYTAGQAKPCTGTVTSGPDETFTTPGGATVGGIVKMCIVANQAVPC